MALAVAAAAVFSWDRWLRFDDAADLQGEWVAEGSDTVILIDGSSIHLTDAEAYDYAIDAGAKTLSLSFGDLSGQARYRFSTDRNQLAIQDGSFDAFGTALDDIAWAWGCLAGAISGQPVSTPSFGEGSLVLVRVGAAQDGESAADEEGPGDAGVSADASGGASADGADGGSGSDTSADGSAGDADASSGSDAAGSSDADEAQKEENAQRAEDALSASGGSGGTGDVGSNAISPGDLL